MSEHMDDPENLEKALAKYKKEYRPLTLNKKFDAEKIDPRRDEKVFLEGVMKILQEQKPPREFKEYLEGLQKILKEHKGDRASLKIQLERYMDLWLHGRNCFKKYDRIFLGGSKNTEDYNPRRDEDAFLEGLTKMLQESKPPREFQKYFEGLQKIVREHKDDPGALRKHLQRYMDGYRPKTLNKKFDAENIDSQRNEHAFLEVLMKLLQGSKLPREVPEFLEGLQKIVREHKGDRAALKTDLQRYIDKYDRIFLSGSKNTEDIYGNQSDSDRFVPPNLPLDMWQWMCSFPGCVVPGTMEMEPPSKRSRQKKKA